MEHNAARATGCSPAAETTSRKFSDKTVNCMPGPGEHGWPSACVVEHYVQPEADGMKPVHWLIEVAISEQSVHEFNSFVDDLVMAADRETGTMACESNFSDDSRLCQIYLRFIDSDAAMVHIAMFSDLFIERFLRICEVRGMLVLGYPDEEVCRALRNFKPVVLYQRAGFARFAS